MVLLEIAQKVDSRRFTSAVTAIERLRAAGFTLSVESDRFDLGTVPANWLTREREQWLDNNAAWLVDALLGAQSGRLVDEISDAIGQGFHAVRTPTGAGLEAPDGRKWQGDELLADGVAEVCERYTADMKPLADRGWTAAYTEERRAEPKGPLLTDGDDF